MTNIYDFEFNKIDGKSKITLKDYKEKVILIVNTASLCGFTKQYAKLEQLWQTYKDQGLVVIGVPSNDFGNQEPKSNDEIASFCELNFGVSFPLTEKTKVIGEEAHPFFKFVKEELGMLAAPKWNFYKYLIDKNGELVDCFASVTAPDSERFHKIIKQHLA